MHGNGLHTKFARPLHNRFQDLAVAEVEPVKISNTDDRSARHVRIGQRGDDSHERMNVAQCI